MTRPSPTVDTDALLEYAKGALIRKLRNWGISADSWDDCMGEGMVGALVALRKVDETFPPKRQRQYVAQGALGYLRHYLRDRGYLIRVPAWYSDQGGKRPEVGRFDPQTCEDVFVCDGWEDDLLSEMEADRLRAKVNRICRQLSPGEREVLQERLDGRTPTEIAARRGAQVHTVNVQLQNARRKVRKAGLERV